MSQKGERDEERRKRGQKEQTEEKLMTTVDDERRGNLPKIVSPSKSSEALEP